MIKHCACLLLFMVFTVHTWSVTQYDTLYINNGTYTAIDGATFPRLAFNRSPVFEAMNAQLNINTNDTLHLTVINTTGTTHGFDIKGINGIQTTINAGSTASISTPFTAVGGYLYYDPLNAPAYHYLGLSGMIVADNFNGPMFYWNIKEHQSDYNVALDAGGSVDWTNYYPDYFTINGKSNPQINADATARVTGNVGQTIRIYIANTGQSVHSLHFHGYHLTIVASSARPADAGKSKDTFPIKPMESLVLELVPDKPGEYPVHDHNLVATTGGGMYPSGMFTTMLIQ